MYVCVCKAVTDKAIRRAAADGADTLFDLQESLGVATGCGSCARAAQDILEAHCGNSRPVLYVPSPA